MPDALNIASYPTIDVENLDASQDLVLFFNNNNPAASTTSQTLLNKSTINKQPKYFLRTIHFNQEPRQSKLNFKTFLNHENLLYTNSRFVCKIECVVNFDKDYIAEADGAAFYHKTLLLPDCYIYKDYGSSNINVTNLKYSNIIESNGSAGVTLSSIYYNNNNYNLKSIITTTNNSIFFEHLSYTRNQHFDTRMNFTIESYT
jgi:hypothetical protein